MTVDVTIDVQGIALLTPRTARATAWLRWHCRDAIWSEGSVACEPSYLGEIAFAMQGHGLRMADPRGRELKVRKR